MNLAAISHMEKIRQKTVAVFAALMSISVNISVASAAADEKHPIQSHQSIRDAAEKHALAAAESLSARPEVEVRNLDSRLKLTACDQPLESYDSPNGLNGGRGVVGVRCNGSKPWKIYVPVYVALMDSVVVSRRPIVRGQALRAEDVMLSEVDISGIHKAYFTRIEDTVGLRSRRSISSGDTLHAGLLERARLVKRGGQVEIVADTGGLQVRMTGKALSDGSQGDRIKVKNLNSGRVVSGTVAGAGLIRVTN
ncbi:MAG: flagellar basal body P-ring formation chaperone FlgA [Sedimenticolaceae bacterium]